MADESVDQALEYLAQGLVQLKSARLLAQKHWRYYDGKHPINISQELRKALGPVAQDFADNLCAPIITCRTDRLHVDSVSPRFSSSSDGTILGAVERIKKESSFERLQDEIHEDGYVAEKTYGIVWQDKFDAAPVIQHNSAQICTIITDPERPRVTLAGVKVWRDGKVYRANIWHGRRCEKFMTGETKAFPTDIKQFHHLPDESLDNETGKPPVYEFYAGKSPLRAAIPGQNVVNRTFLSTQVGVDNHALPQRHASGVPKPEPDPVTGITPQPWQNIPGSVWAAGKDASFGQFTAADLRQLIDVIENQRLEMFRTTNTPPHLVNLGSGSTPVAADAKRRDEKSLTTEIGKRQKAYSDAWEDLFEHGLLFLGIEADLAINWAPADWEDPTPKTDAEKADLALKLKELGRPYWRILVDVYGYAEEDAKAEQLERDGELAAVQDRAQERARQSLAEGLDVAA